MSDHFCLRSSWISNDTNYCLVAIKSPEHGLGINMGKKCKLSLPCASFEEKCAQTRTFPIYHSMGIRGNHFLVHRHKKDLPPITCIFSSFKICSQNFLSFSHFTSLAPLNVEVNISVTKRLCLQITFLCHALSTQIKLIY